MMGCSLVALLVHYGDLAAVRHHLGRYVYGMLEHAPHACMHMCICEDELVALFRRRLQPINHETTKRTVAGTTQLYVLLANQLYWGVLSAIGHPLAWVPFAAVPVFHLLCVFG